MSATVTDKHREIADQIAGLMHGIGRPVLQQFSAREVHSMSDDIAQAIADAEVRGREAAVQDFEEEAWAWIRKKWGPDAASQFADRYVGKDLLALLDPKKVQP
jgi:hypothetical protein